METKIFRDSEYVRSYDEKGVAWTELLPGTFEPMKCYKCNLKAGSEVSPERYGDKAVVFIFGKGTGYIAGTDGGFKINGVCFYAPDFDKAEYYIHAFTDLEFVMCVADMDDYDRERAAECHVYTPFFRTIEQCYPYDQSCKTPGTWSRSVLFGDFGRLGKITMGACRGQNNGGTIEKGHREVHQWNYSLGDSDYILTVEGNEIERKTGDWDFIPAGLDHSLVAGEGKEVYYVWVEFYTSKHGIH